MSFVSILKTVGSVIIKHAPEICTGISIVSKVAAVGFTIKGTIESKDIIDKYRFERQEIHEAEEFAHEIIRIHDEGTETLKEGAYEDALKMIEENTVKKDIVRLYVRTGLEFAKVFAPAIGCLGLSVTSELVAFNVLKARLAKIQLAATASAATASALAASYDAYRQRVKQVVGDEKEEAIFKNEKIEMREVTEIDEDGNEVKVEKAVKTYDNKHDPYAMKIVKGMSCYQPMLYDTLSNLKQLELWANQQMIMDAIGKGKSTRVLNDILDMFPAERTTMASIAGWTYYDDPVEQEQSKGDGYISFGLFEHPNEATLPEALCEPWRTILTENPNARTDDYDIWLFFNVDGPVIDDYEDIIGIPK